MAPDDKAVLNGGKTGVLLNGGTEERRRAFLKGVSTMGLAGFFAGCTGGPSDGDGDGAATDTPGDGDGDGDGGMTDTPGDGDGDGDEEFTVTILFSQFPAPLDPHAHSDSEIYSTLTALIEYPFWMDQRQSPAPFVPKLATDWGFVDRTTFETTTREGVKWHSGDDFKAEDIAFTVERISDPDVSLVSDIQADWDFIDSMEAENGNNKVIWHLTEPNTLLPIQIGARCNIVNKDWIEAREPPEIARNVEGTGPYQQVNLQEGTEFEVEKFEDWWAYDADQDFDPMPGFPDRILFRAASEASSRANQIIAGEADIARAINVEDWERVNNSDAGRMKRFNIDRTAYIAMNDVKAPFDRKDGDVYIVKKAFNHAIDRQAIVDTILNGSGRPLASLQASQWPGFNDQIEPVPYDPDAAQQAYDDSGAEPHHDFELVWVPGLPKYREIALSMANQLTQNIEQVTVETKQVTPAGFDDARKADGTHEGRVRLWTATTGGSPPHNGPGKLGSYGHSNGHSSSVTEQDFDDLYDTLADAQDLEEANQIAKDLHQMVRDRHLLGPLHQMQGAMAISNRIDISIPANENMHPYLITPYDE